jgi:hypothetical protein
MNWIVEFAITIITGLLHTVIKNPASYASLLTVLQDLDIDLQQAISALQAGAPTGTTATAATKTALQLHADRVSGKNLK